MFERFTEKARQAVLLGQEAARDRERDRIDTVALLLGLLRGEDTTAKQVLEGLRVSDQSVLMRWGAIMGEGLPPGIEPGDSQAQIPFTDWAKKALEMALREALGLGHNYIGTEHILLGVIRIRECAAMDVLAEIRGTSNREELHDQIYTEVVRALSGPGGRQRAATPTQPNKLHDYNYQPEGEGAELVRRVHLSVYEDGSITLEVLARERLVCDQLYLGKQVRVKLMPKSQSTTQGE